MGPFWVQIEAWTEGGLLLASPQSVEPKAWPAAVELSERIYQSSQFGLHMLKQTKIEAYVELFIDKVPPVLAAESIIERLAGGIVEGSVTSVEIRMLGP